MANNKKQELVAKHIKAIKQLVPNRITSEKDGVLLFSVPTSSETLSISLDMSSSDFPEHPPILKLVPNHPSQHYTHYLMNSATHTFLFPSLSPSAWTPHCNLALLLRGILHDLSQYPPVLESSSRSFAQEQGQQSMKEVLKESFPSIPSKYEEISEMCLEEIQLLLENEALFKKLLQGQQVYQSILGMKTELREQVLEKAKGNLEYKSVLEELKGQVSELKSVLDEQLAEKRALDDERAQYLDRYSLGNVEKALFERIEVLDEESEEVVQELRDGSKGVAEAASEYVLSRKEFHRLSLMSECLSLNAQDHGF